MPIYDITTPEGMDALDKAVLNLRYNKSGRAEGYYVDVEGHGSEDVTLRSVSDDIKHALKVFWIEEKEHKVCRVSVRKGHPLNTALTILQAKVDEIASKDESLKGLDFSKKPIIKECNKEGGDPFVQLTLKFDEFGSPLRTSLRDEKGDATQVDNLVSQTYLKNWMLSFNKFTLTPSHGLTPRIFLEYAHVSADQPVSSSSSRRTENKRERMIAAMDAKCAKKAKTQE